MARNQLIARRGSDPSAANAVTRANSSRKKRSTLIGTRDRDFDHRHMAVATELTGSDDRRCLGDRQRMRTIMGHATCRSLVVLVKVVARGA